MTDDKPGVIEQERARAKKWADRGLPDPVAVEAGERATEALTHGAHFRSPDRAVLDAYFEAHPEDRPPNW